MKLLEALILISLNLVGSHQKVLRKPIMRRKGNLIELDGENNQMAIYPLITLNILGSSKSSGKKDLARFLSRRKSDDPLIKIDLNLGEFHQKSLRKRSKRGTVETEIISQISYFFKEQFKKKLSCQEFKFDYKQNFMDTLTCLNKKGKNIIKNIDKENMEKIMGKLIEDTTKVNRVIKIEKGQKAEYLVGDKKQEYFKNFFFYDEVYPVQVIQVLIRLRCYDLVAGSKNPKSLAWALQPMLQKETFNKIKETQWISFNNQKDKGTLCNN